MTEAEARALATHRHYKGGLCRVTGVARPAEIFSDTLPDGTPRFQALAIPL
jgi:hypothetical protein